MSLYDDLQIDRDASAELIEIAYNTQVDKSQKTDKGSISEAYKVLSDPEKRKEYDEKLRKVSFYDELQVHKDMDVESIRRTFLLLSLQNHPDKVVDKVPEDESENEEKLRLSKRKAITDKYARILEAYRVLSDSSLRRMYDLTGEVLPQGDMDFEEKEELRKELHSYLRWYRDSVELHTMRDMQGDVLLQVPHRNIKLQVKNPSGFYYPNIFLIQRFLKKLKTEYVERMLKSICY